LIFGSFYVIIFIENRKEFLVKNKREFCISTVRGILQEKRIRYKEIEAESGSIYFRLYLETSTPCLRLSDHHHGRKRPSMTIYWLVGENAKEKNIRNRIELLINKMIKNSKIGKTIEAIKRLGENNA
jgi:REP element-mobilizing transposase RayT